MNNIPDLSLSSNSLSLVFKGNVNYEVVDSIAKLISDRLEKIEEDINIRKKVFSVLIESLQNLGNHVKGMKTNNVFFEYDTSSIMFMLDTVKDGYKIVTANFIEHEKAEMLKDKIENIKLLSINEIRQKYNEVLLFSEYTETGGGGLGILDIALKTNGLIDYSFEKVNDDLSFFSLQTTIQKVK